MTLQSLSIVPSTRKEDLKKERLRIVIQKKREVLEDLVIKTEMLRVNLEITQQEYMVKVGRLFLKDNKLDLEIIQLKNILQLMKRGLSYEHAVIKIEKTFYAEQLELEREQEQLEYEEEIYKKRAAQESTFLEDLKKVWKRLIAKFHPDLVQDHEEKKKYDAIMKLINRAYQEGDLDTLTKIEQENLSAHEETVDNLEEILVRVIKEIMKQRSLYSELKKSEWYGWTKKIEQAKKRHQNIFAETEKQLLDDIVAKIKLIKDLKAEIRRTNNL